MDDGSRWDWVRYGYPYASVLFAPLCLILGWYWVALATSLLGAAMVTRYHWMRSMLTIPLFMLCIAEVLIALNLIIYAFKDSLKAGG